MRYLKNLLPTTILLTGITLLTACSSMRPNVAVTFSKAHPKYIVPMLILPQDYPLIAWDHNALPSSVAACFRVDRNGQAHDITITHVSIPDTVNKKLEHKIRGALGAYAQNLIRGGKFYTDMVNGKRVNSPRACQDFRFMRQQFHIGQRGAWTISRLRPKDIVPMVRMEPLVPQIVLANNAAPSSVTACFDVERNGQTSNVTITRISIPKASDKKLDRKIEVALGASVLGAVKQSLFFPKKVQGKPVESPHVCEDYTLHFLR